nr:competence type IV pilus major pilin ComGC [Lysinibacillus timonensis]
MLKHEKGFTLIEMMIVLLIISVLIIITIPNVTKHFATIDEKGCEAYVTMVQGQVEAYRIENNKYPTVQELIQDKYITSTNCPNGKQTIVIDENGNVTTEPVPPN